MSTCRFRTLVAALAATCSSLATAQVVMDGSVGPGGALTGPNYNITPDLGKQVGQNLFQSFTQFNLANGESATFVGTQNLLNIIARVTGGSVSQIDGTIHTQMAPNVTLWFINPAGIVFGANASLDVGGSVYFSTASSLKLGSDGSFDAVKPDNSTLTASAPSAFVFANANVAPIQLTGANLAGAPDSTLAFIGGDITMSSAHLQASGGTVLLDSVSSAGVAPIAADGTVDVSSFPSHGTVNISQDPNGADASISAIDVTGTDMPGRVVIRAGQFFLQDAQITNRNFSEVSGGSVDIQADQSATFSGAAAIFTDTFTDINASDIRIAAPTISLGGTALISTKSEGSGNGGAITVNATQLNLSDTARVTAESDSTGNGGDITITAANAMNMSGSAFVDSITTATGNAGKISIQTGALALTDNATVNSQAAPQSTGNGGDILINANTVSVVGTGQGAPGDSAEITAETDGSGNGGVISINAASMQLGGLALVTTHGTSSGNAGKVQINLSGALGMDSGSEILASTSGAGLGGAVALNAGSVALSNGSAIASVASDAGNAGTVMISAKDVSLASQSSVSTSTSGAGNAGSIQLNATNLAMNTGAQIQAQTSAGGVGGDVTVKVANLTMASTSRINLSSTGTGNAGTLTVDVSSGTTMNNAQITTAAATADGGNILLVLGGVTFLDNSAITTSVQSGVGNGGNITLGHPDLLVLQKSRIQANAYGGNGGNIAIAAGQLIKSSESVIEASSQLGVSGGISINAPDNDVGSSLAALPVDFGRQPLVVADACARAGGSRLIVRGSGSLADAPAADSRADDAGYGMKCATDSK